MRGAATRKQPGSRTASLEQQRLRAGLSLDEIADRTKISIRFLRAIETGDFEQLPAGIFATSYIRQYAEAIGSDPEKILARYREQCCPEQEARAQESPERSRRSLGGWFRALGLIKSR